MILVEGDVILDILLSKGESLLYSRAGATLCSITVPGECGPPGVWRSPWYRPPGGRQVDMLMLAFSRGILNALPSPAAPSAGH